jgi:hypothetical protein
VRTIREAIYGSDVYVSDVCEKPRDAAPQQPLTYDQTWEQVFFFFFRGGVREFSPIWASVSFTSLYITHVHVRERAHTPRVLDLTPQLPHMLYKMLY